MPQVDERVNFVFLLNGPFLKVTQKPAKFFYLGWKEKLKSLFYHYLPGHCKGLWISCGFLLENDKTKF